MQRLTVIALVATGYGSLCLAQPAAPLVGVSSPEFSDTEIGDRNLRHLCSGEGAPTVIVEAGLGGTPLETVFAEDPRSGWAIIVSEVALETRICVYDRAGVGLSDGAPTPRTSLDAVIDLDRMLRVADIQPPYVLAGRSFGGLNTRLFADRHPGAVAGMVLIDATHPDLWDRWSSALPPPNEGERAELVGFREPPGSEVLLEGIDIVASLELARSVTSLGDIPLVVMTVRSDFDDPNVPNDLETILRPIAFDLQRALLDLSSSAEFIVAQSAGHNIHVDEPHLVTEAILSVVRKVRERQREGT